MNRPASGQYSVCKTLLFFFVIHLLCLFSGLEQAPSPDPSKKTVAILLEKDIKIYRLAYEGLESALNSYALSKKDMMGDRSRGEKLAHEMNRKKPDLIVAIGTDAAVIARETIRDIPIVFCLALHPEEKSLVGESICGVSLNVPFGDQLAVLKQLALNIKKIGVIYDPDYTEGVVAEATETAARMETILVARPARNMEEVAEALKDMEESQEIDAFWMIFDPVLVNKLTYKVILLFTLQNKIPLIVPVEPFVEAGALVALSPNYREAGKQAGSMVEKILADGVSPGQIGIVFPASMDIAVNTGIAKNLGLRVPEDLPVNHEY